MLTPAHKAEWNRTLFNRLQHPTTFKHIAMEPTKECMERCAMQEDLPHSSTKRNVMVCHAAHSRRILPCGVQRREGLCILAWVCWEAYLMSSVSGHGVLCYMSDSTISI